MSFSPIKASERIEKQYKGYLKTMFAIDDEDYESQFKKQLDAHSSFVAGPYLDVQNIFATGSTTRDLVEKGVLPRYFLKYGFYHDRPLYTHQETALYKALKGKNIVVSTGTGSGKTESFLMPILAGLASEVEKNTISKGVRALLIYPMNALANDQIERLRDLLSDTPEITFGCYTGQTNEFYPKALAEYKKLNKKEPNKNELISREQMKAAPPHILITNYAMLEYLMVRPDDNVFFKDDTWRYIVLDEAHVYRGSTGIEVSMLLRRLGATLRGCRLQYFLTSATLGDESENAAVAEFARNLSNSYFSEEDIIRAIRITPTKPASLMKVPSSVYREAAEKIEDGYEKGEIDAWLKEAHPELSLHSPDALYEMVEKDELYWGFRDLLKVPTPIQTIAEELELKEEEVTLSKEESALNEGGLISKEKELVLKEREIELKKEEMIERFVTVASFCESNGIRLFDARYHAFLRATDSVFITLAPSKKLFLERRKQYQDLSEKRTFKVFEIQTCTSCHAIYLTGAIDPNTDCLEQSTKLSGRDFFYLGENASNTDEDSEKEESRHSPARICAICGHVRHLKLRRPVFCEHGQDYEIPVVQVELKNGALKKCVCCEAVNNNGILRSFFTGQEAVTSVLATSLFNVLPTSETRIKIEEAEEDDFGFGFGEESGLLAVQKTNQAKQFLCFSDSRQASAFFATYLDATYRKLLYRRILTEQLERMDAMMPISYFCEDVGALFDKLGVLKGTGYRYEKEAWKALLAEIVGMGSDASIFGMGLACIGLRPDSMPSNQKLNMSGEEVSSLFNVLLGSMLTDLALNIPIAMTEEDREFYGYGAVGACYVAQAGASNKALKSFIPKSTTRSNKRLDYVLRILEKKFPGRFDDSKARELLLSLWKQLGRMSVLESVRDGFQLKTDPLYIFKPKRWYRCDKCHKLTAFNIADICVTYKCNGTLKEVNPAKELEENHYYRRCHDMEIRPLRVKEHTAQLTRDKAYEYQQEFKDKKLDVLSCSTTFEMGVDVGSLETVFMRNMPPMPSNYAQRAGRAGRSSNAAAFALTFCNRSNHDFSYFNRPVDMISGKIHAPHFNILNEKIAIRHLYAVALAFFWRSHPAYFNTVGQMEKETPDTASSSGFDVLRQYLESKPEDLREFARNFLPQSLYHSFACEDYGWVKGLFDEDEGVLSRAISEYKYEVGLLDQARIEAFEANRSTGYFEARLRTYRTESILAFMSRKNVVPRYGFPVDTVEMQIVSKNAEAKFGVELQRDLGIAIAEYAPDSQVVANGLLFTGRYIRTIPNIGWKMYDYVYCDDCGTLNIDVNTGTEVSEEDLPVKTCRVCQSVLDASKIRTFIIPLQGFSVDPEAIAKPSLIRPERTYRSDVSYVGYRSASEFISVPYRNTEVKVVFSAKDEMAVVNKSEFYICEKCGYGKVENVTFRKKMQLSHKAPSGHKCYNEWLKRYSLGYRFETDVLIMYFPDHPISYGNEAEAYSVMYALLRGIIDVLNLEDSDVSGCLQSITTMSGKGYSFVFYDTIPGGAGHMRRLQEPYFVRDPAGERKQNRHPERISREKTSFLEEPHFVLDPEGESIQNGHSTTESAVKTFVLEEASLLAEVIDKACELMKSCTCGGKEGNTSCYACLRSYRNQKIHDILERSLAIRYFERL